jgi:outer membrane protein
MRAAKNAPASSSDRNCRRPWPGADKFSVGPYIDVSRTRETEFEFEAPDESFGSPLIHSGNFAFGPAFGFIGKRKASDIGADLPKVGLSVEAGGFAQMSLAPELRVRVEGRKGLSGHKGWVGEVSADYIARQGATTGSSRSARA